MKYFLFSLFCFPALSAVGTDVLIQGKILSEFDENKVKIQDSQKQIYFLPRRLFPKDVLIKQGTEFSFEVHEKEIDKVKILKK
jgi:hypothetical protein